MTANGFHHRHFMGTLETVEFVSFEAIEDRFQADWLVFRRKGKQ